MISQENLGPLQTDLIIEIFSRLPSKSIARFHCLSKLWASLLAFDSLYFTELFLTQSKTRPRLLFSVERKNNCCLYSCPQPQISYDNSKSSFSVTLECHMSLRKFRFFHLSRSISGLICCPNTPKHPMLCNPNSGHIFSSIPKLEAMIGSYFGYDPINKKFSILAICNSGFFPYDNEPSSYKILKLTCGRLSWRTLDYHLQHCPAQANVCINGVLYYLAFFIYGHALHRKIVSFDLNSEEFNLIDEPRFDKDPAPLVNFKGKLGAIMANWVEFSNETFQLQVELWVLEDAEKQKWSKHVYNILQSELWNQIKGKPDYRVKITMTVTGDIVLSLPYTTNPFYVYFFNLEKKVLQKVEIKGFEGFERDIIYGCVEYVEELRALKWN